MKKAGIIGAGLGGLSLGVLLINKGYEVDLYEKEKVVGGRTMTLNGNCLTLDTYRKILHRFGTWIPFSEPDMEIIFKKHLLDGYRLDIGFHLLGLIGNSPLQKVLGRGKKNLQILSSRFGLITPADKIVYPFSSYFSLKDKLKLVQYFIRLFFMTKSHLKLFQQKSVEELIQEYGRGKIAEYTAIAARLVSTVNDLSKISSGDLLRVGKRWGMGVKPTGYPEEGIMSFAKALSKMMIDNGGKLFLNTKVEKVLIKNRVAEGIVVEGKKCNYDIIVVNLPVQDLFGIVDQHEFPESYIHHIKSLQPSAGVCAYYGLKAMDSNLIGKPFVFVENNVDVEGGSVTGIIDFKTAHPQMKMSPPDQYLVQGYAICSLEESKDKGKVELLRKILDQKLELLLPHYRDHLIFGLYPTCFQLDGVAKTVDNPKPESETPVKNLYLVGDGIQSAGIGMNCAVDSAVRLAKILLISKGGL